MSEKEGPRRNRVKAALPESTKSYSVPASTEQFYMAFIDNMSGMFKLRSISDIKVLAKMCMLAESNTGKVLLPTNLRKEIEEELGITTQTMTNALSRLKKLGLIKGDKGSFQINEKVFWKGDIAAREKLLEKNGLLTFKVEI